MTYIEELDNGECFIFNDDYYIVSCDFNSQKKRFCINLVDGNARWFKGNTIVKNFDIYRIDDDNNLIMVKQKNDKKNNNIL